MGRIEVSCDEMLQKEDFGKEEYIPKIIQTHIDQGYSASPDKIGDFISEVIAAATKGTDHEPVKYTLTLVGKEIPTT